MVFILNENYKKSMYKILITLVPFVYIYLKKTDINKNNSQIAFETSQNKLTYWKPEVEIFANVKFLRLTIQHTRITSLKNIHVTKHKISSTFKRKMKYLNLIIYIYAMHIFAL